MKLPVFESSRMQKIRKHWEELKPREEALKMKVAGTTLQDPRLRDPETELLYKEFQAAVMCVMEAEASSYVAMGSFEVRIVAELTGPVIKKDRSGCVENEKSVERFCPEGTSPQFLRASDPARARLWAGIGFTFSLPIGAAVGGLVGAARGAFMGGLPVMAVTIPHDMYIGLALPLGGPLAAVGAALGRKHFTASCKCFENSCELDASTDRCVMTTSEKSSNPWQKLPFPGQKCTRTKSGCAMMLCSDTDLQDRTEEVDGFTGIVGDQPDGVYNCLSLGAVPYRNLISLEELYGGPNSAEGRGVLYDKIQKSKDNKMAPEISFTAKV